jgi:ABC-type multidrug transport system permease subunit
MYNLSAYYIARTFADIPAELINTLLFVIIAYWFGGLKHDAGAFFGLLFRWVVLSPLVGVRVGGGSS